MQATRLTSIQCGFAKGCTKQWKSHNICPIRFHLSKRLYFCVETWSKEPRCALEVSISVSVFRYMYVYTDLNNIFSKTLSTKKICWSCLFIFCGQCIEQLCVEF